MATFQRATKFDARLRLALSGPAGAGKTFTALTLATALADGKPIALIDTEHGSASKYADVFAFDTLELLTFHPRLYIEAIEAAQAAGYAVLVIDSLSHAWKGAGGLLEENDRIAATKYKGNSYMAWNDSGKIQNRLVSAILGCKMHVIATVRSKMDYVLEKDERTGKTSPHKVGMAPVQRDDLPYEFDVFCSMRDDNTLIVEKTRCPALTGAVIDKPDAKMAGILSDWLKGEKAPAKAAEKTESEPAPEKQPEQPIDLEIRRLIKKVADETHEQGATVASWLRDYVGVPKGQMLQAATPVQKQQAIKVLTERLPVGATS